METDLKKTMMQNVTVHYGQQDLFRWLNVMFMNETETKMK